MSTHCDLGSRYPIGSCPTRIIKKEGYQEIPKKANVNLVKPGNATIASIAMGLGTSRQTLRGMAIRIFKTKKFLGGLTPEMRAILTEYFLNNGTSR